MHPPSTKVEMPNTKVWHWKNEEDLITRKHTETDKNMYKDLIRLGLWQSKQRNSL
jgi:hypothetical protein